MTDDRGEPSAPPRDHGVYGISVTAELSGIAVQSLRLYERYGLLTPARSEGGTRRYSAEDLARLRRISELVDAGINLVGIARILELEDHNATLSAANTDLRSTNRTLRKAVKTARGTEGSGTPADGSPPDPAT
ncbi:MerR family transcriptional regulator [Mycobacterium sp.]|uniref:MerR family transcriptional regulator n=2 Tax=Mycobacterium sp. TaxID=1785 RepID=UPI003F9B7BBD